MHVMLKRTRNGTFFRSVTDAKGNVKKRMEFSKGNPVELKTKAEREAVKNDIGVALVQVKLIDGRWKPVPEETAEEINDDTSETESDSSGPGDNVEEK